jgi:hypothetical protein
MTVEKLTVEKCTQWIVAWSIPSLTIAIVFGYVLGRLNTIPDPLSIVIGIVTSVITSATLIPLTIEKRIQSVVKTEKVKVKALYESQTSEQIQKRQRIEFLSILDENLQPSENSLDPLDNVRFGGVNISTLCEENETFEEFKRRVRKNKKYRQACQEAVQGLSGDNNQNNKDPLMPIVKTAVNLALGRKSESEVTPEVFNYYEDVYVYLKVWLICSIKYDTNMPIEWINMMAQDKRKHIEALSYIKDKILNSRNIKELLPTQESREVAAKYIGNLVDGLSI